MKSNPYFHAQLKKDLGWVRIAKLSILWKNLKKAPKLSAENLGSPNTIRIGSYSVRVMVVA